MAVMIAEHLGCMEQLHQNFVHDVLHRHCYWERLVLLQVIKGVIGVKTWSLLFLLFKFI